MSGVDDAQCTVHVIVVCSMLNGLHIAMLNELFQLHYLVPAFMISRTLTYNYCYCAKSLAHLLYMCLSSQKVIHLRTH